MFHFFTDKNLMGDRNHALAIAETFKEKYPSGQVMIKEWTGDQFLEFKKEVLNQNLKVPNLNKAIVCGIGTAGLKVLKRISEESELELKNKLFTVFSSHQFIEEAIDLQGKINIMAFDENAIDEEILEKLKSADEKARKDHQNYHYIKTQIVTMNGIPHRVTSSFVRSALDNWRKNLTVKAIPPADRYIAVILGGDAPDSLNKQRYFLPEEAAVFAEFIAKEAREMGATVLVTNGPRTGKFNPVTGEDLFAAGKVHKESKEGKELELDKVTKAFENVLKTKEVSYLLVNYIKKEPQPPSAYQPFIGLVLENPTAKMYVTIDSSSNMSEIRDVLPKTQLNLVQIGSANATHIKQMESILREGRAQGFVVDKVEKSVKPISIIATDLANVAREPAAETVATAIVHGVKS